ncbi:type II toxin-antitoxin system HicB family antitoxin [Mesorhizobium humile]|uniref:Type II toxin-antitoxin system HicB family antitoxin n=1 Tax=Mesorhizobium humile TaxID=3072313 RepID=A0ABU4YR18_9HYPH|nr:MULTISPECIES: type II toxin-antitoxin system HicB family antitoxin [unclassified Mesorhizobium]MDX8460867.1 type II toxin-antitoxin system HicB family antitoxin [Mesorhizobium sp. VK2D]MDX8489434.1 type II toxin-antitoxin system HicB family antitoxin [Mesorhizobium sp. VK2B]
MTGYVGILDGSNDVWGVRVPDLPGCHGGGVSPEQAIADASLAIREWTEARVAKQLPVPKPRALADLLRSGEIDSAHGDSAVIVRQR